MYRTGEYPFTQLQRELLESKIIAIKADITQEMSEYVHECLMYFRANGSPDIEVLLRSSGGNAIPGFEMYDDLRLYSGKTRGVVMGYAFSMTAVILQACTQRLAARNAVLHIHNTLLNGVSTKILRTKDGVAMLKKSGNDVDVRNQKILADRSGRTLREVRELCDLDVEMSAQKALKFGLVDELI